MKLNNSKIWLEVICSSLHTDLLNLRTMQHRISVVSVIRSGNYRNWMWNRIICWCYNWGCHPTCHMLLWGRNEGSLPWATSDHLPQNYCTLSPFLLLLCIMAAPALSQSLCCGRVATGVSWFLPLHQSSFPDDWNPLMFLRTWGHCWLTAIVTLTL